MTDNDDLAHIFLLFFLHRPSSKQVAETQRMRTTHLLCAFVHKCIYSTSCACMYCAPHDYSLIFFASSKTPQRQELARMLRWVSSAFLGSA